jgi:hypothetical protein
LKVRVIRAESDDPSFTHPIRVGDIYPVLAVSTASPGIFVHVPYPEVPDQIALLPGTCLEIIEPRVPSDWTVALFAVNGMSDTEYLFGPPALHEPYFHDRLSDQEPEAVAMFRGVLAKYGIESY